MPETPNCVTNGAQNHFVKFCYFYLKLCPPTSVHSKKHSFCDYINCPPQIPFKHTHKLEEIKKKCFSNPKHPNFKGSNQIQNSLFTISKHCPNLRIQKCFKISLDLNPSQICSSLMLSSSSLVSRSLLVEVARVKSGH